MPSAVRHFYEFGEFRLDAEKRRLLRDGEVVPLSPKSIEALLVLVQNPGKPLEREALMQAVWADTFVEDANLTVAISNLRKALGQSGETAEYIETVPRVGYRFIGDVREIEEAPTTLVLEKHTVSRTIIEEETIHDEPSTSQAIVVRPTFPTLRFVATRRRATAIAAAIIVSLFGGAFAYYLYKRSISTTAPGRITSIAVLPLRTFTQSTDDSALSLGFADSLITDLGKVHGVRVLPVNAVSKYSNAQEDAAQIGRNLNVDGVIDGTLQRANGKIRVTLRLVRSSDGVQIWSRSFENADSRIFQLEDEMAFQTTESLKWTLTEAERREITKRYTDNSEAYQAYLRGRFFFDQRNREAYDGAIAQFQRAIELDPRFAPAYSGLADVYALQANVQGGQERDALYEKAKSTAMRALELDDSLAEAHTSLGWIRREHDWDWYGAEREFKRAIELNPNYASAHEWYSFLLLTLGRMDEALAEMQRAVDLDPLSRRILLNSLAVRIFRGEYQQAWQIVQQIMDLGDNESAEVGIISNLYFVQGDYAKVIEMNNSSSSGSEQSIGDFRRANLAVAYARTGQDAKANELLNILEAHAKKNSGTAYRLAMACSDLGRREEAIRLLEQCLAAHDDRMVWIKIEPRFDPLRNDARFQELLRKINLFT